MTGERHFLADRGTPQTTEAPRIADVIAGQDRLASKYPVNVGYWDVATVDEIVAKQRKRNSASPKPPGRRWCRTATAALHIADYGLVTLRVAFKSARLWAF